MQLTASLKRPVQVLCECSALQQADASAWGRLLQALLAYLDGHSTQGSAALSDAEADEGKPQACACLMDMLISSNAADPARAYAN